MNAPNKEVSSTRWLIVQVIFIDFFVSMIFFFKMIYANHSMVIDKNVRGAKITLSLHIGVHRVY
jgi:hypothetical protein